jgi:SAM-dependent methyltransferase
MNEDTKAFAETLYLRSDGKDYAKNYLDPNYQERTDLIYRPKLDFLLENLSPADEVELLDVGCGSGYFVYAALMANINAFGIDINQTMIDSGNQQILHLKNLEPLTYVGESKYFEIIANTTASVISAIGVIEHLRRPELFFNAFQSSKAQYLYFSVPMFSLSVIIENVMQGVFPRQLSGGHTHLFTEESIQWILRNWGLDSVAEWRFGTDIMDFYRSIRIEAEARGGSKKFMELIDGGLLKNIDKLQETLDNSHFCSEIHCLFKKI